MKRVLYAAVVAAALVSVASAACAGSRVISRVEYSTSDHFGNVDYKDVYGPSAPLSTSLFAYTDAGGPGYSQSSSTGSSTAWYGLQQVQVQQIGSDGIYGGSTAWENIEASAYVEDTLHLNVAGAADGTTGWAHFALYVDASKDAQVNQTDAYSATAVATTSVQVTMSGSGINARYGFYQPLSLVADTTGFTQFRSNGSYNEYGSLQFTTITPTSFSGLYVVDVPFVAGGAIGLATNVSCDSQIQQFGGTGALSSTCDMAHTVRWGGLIDAVDSSGAPVDLRVTSDSGLDYRLAVTEPGSVPEPVTWALMIAGFGAVGGRLRRTRATAAVAG